MRLIHGEITMRAILRILVGVWLIHAGAAAAITVNVDPGSYLGEWRIDSEAVQSGGSVANFDLAVGSHQAIIGYTTQHPFAGNVFSFDVDSSGAVTVPNGISATGGIGILDFNTRSLTVNTGAYVCSRCLWYFNLNVTPFFQGSQIVNLVPGIEYYVGVGSGADQTSGAAVASIAGNGTVTVLNEQGSPTISATGGIDTLTFNTTTLSVNPAGFTGTWSVGFGISDDYTGSATPTIIPGLQYKMVVAKPRSNAQFFIQHATDGSGLVTVPNGVSGFGGVNALTFAPTETVFIDPGSFSGTWELGSLLTATGPASVEVVPMGSSTPTFGRYRLYNISGGGGFEEFSVATPCAVEPASLVVLGATFQLSCGACTDNDGDGFGAFGSASCPETGVDCDDLDSSVFPGAPELCDGLDNDCDGLLPANESDLDGDGFFICENDCDDADPDLNPNAVELPGNVVDENCDGSLGSCDPYTAWRNHGQFVRCVAQEVNDLRGAGLISDVEGDGLVSSAAESDVGR